MQSASKHEQGSQQVKDEKESQQAKEKPESQPTEAEQIVKPETEVSEPAAKKAKVQYGLAKFFKPEAREYKPVVLEVPKVGRPPKMTEALKETLEKAQIAEKEKVEMLSSLKEINRDEALRNASLGGLVKAEKRRMSGSSHEPLGGVSGGEKSNRRALGQKSKKTELSAPAKASIAKDIYEMEESFASENELLRWAKAKYGLEKATLRRILDKKHECEAS